jgi:N-formylglutamate deformylase
VLFDGHSIKSQLPWLFEGQLPDLNLGTADGASCDSALRDAVAAVLAAQDRFTHVVDGRFKGGHITRHYGQPAQGFHAVQLEQCWRSYLDEARPSQWDPAQAERVMPLLRSMVDVLLNWRPTRR